MTTEKGGFRMETVTSADGTMIAFERFGSGEPLVLVCGAFNNRHMVSGLAVEAAEHFTVITYDRRGRGDSGDQQPYDVQREIEDLAAVVGAAVIGTADADSAGGGAFVHGASSGAVLALRAAAAGLPIRRLSVIEPPFRVPGAPPAPAEYAETIVELTTTGRRGEAAEYFMTAAVGLPPEAVAGARQDPIWPVLEGMAHTLAYDAYVMGDNQVPHELLASITTPTLVLNSTASPDWLRDASAATAKGLPNAEYRELEGSFHDVPPATMTHALAAFFLGNS